MADLGKVGITYESDYDNTKTYEPLSVVKYTDGGTYLSIVSTTGNIPTDATKWAVLVPPDAQTKTNMVQTNVNNAVTYPSSALLYSMNDEINSSLEDIDSRTDGLNMRVVGGTNAWNAVYSTFSDIPLDNGIIFASIYQGTKADSMSPLPNADDSKTWTAIQCILGGSVGFRIAVRVNTGNIYISYRWNNVFSAWSKMAKE